MIPSESEQILCGVPIRHPELVEGSDAPLVPKLYLGSNCLRNSIACPPSFLRFLCSFAAKVIDP